MKKFYAFAAVAIVASAFVAPADAGLFGRGRGLFRGKWGSRNVNATASKGSTCSGPACTGPACQAPAAQPD